MFLVQDAFLTISRLFLGRGGGGICIRTSFTSSFMTYVGAAPWATLLPSRVQPRAQGGDQGYAEQEDRSLPVNGGWVVTGAPTSTVICDLAQSLHYAYLLWLGNREYLSQ